MEKKGLEWASCSLRLMVSMTRHDLHEYSFISLIWLSRFSIQWFLRMLRFNIFKRFPNVPGCLQFTTSNILFNSEDCHKGTLKRIPITKTGDPRVQTMDVLMPLGHKRLLWMRSRCICTFYWSRQSTRQCTSRDALANSRKIKGTGQFDKSHQKDVLGSI